MLLSLGLSLLQFVSIVSLLLNHRNPIFESVCVFLPFPRLPFLFLYEWTSSLSACLQFGCHHHSDSTITSTFIYFLGSIRNLVLNHCDICAVPSVCNTVGLLILIEICPAFTFLQQLMTRGLWVIYTYTSSENYTCIYMLLKVGLGISRTNADSQWNPVYNVFHRIVCCGNETIRL